MNIIKRKGREHLQSSWWIYVFVGVCFLVGVVFGLLGVQSLNLDQQASLLDFVDKGLAGFVKDPGSYDTARQAFNKNIIGMIKIFCLGLTVIGFPLILAIIFTRGFVIGFSFAFLIHEKAWKGVLLSLMTIIAPNLLSLPVYILSAAIAINFSFYLLRGGNQRNIPLTQYAAGYLLCALFLGILMGGAALIEGYFSPMAIRFLK